MIRLNPQVAQTKPDSIALLYHLRQHTSAYQQSSLPVDIEKSMHVSHHRALTTTRKAYRDQRDDRKHKKGNEGFRWRAPSVLAVTAAIALTRQYRYVVAGTPATPDQASFSVRMYQMLPLRLLSRIWGIMNSVVLPEWARETVYSVYGRIFGCLMHEVEKPLKEYRNLGEFFTRRLKPGSRPIAETDMVSPVDGRVLTFGKVTSDTVEQVKGIRYSMGYFLGESIEPLLKSGRNLYQIVIYLAPGDYHGFHSPVDYKMEQRVHFHGHMLSVSKVAARYVPGLFGINERVVLRGTWKGGVLFYSPVAATNVGNIAIHGDPEVRTNVSGGRWVEQEQVSKTYEESIEVEKGEEIGFFKLGSTVVMVFESEEDFEFLCNEGDKLRLGQPLGRVVKKD